jgi:hypothetical protein
MINLIARPGKLNSLSATVARSIEAKKKPTVYTSVEIENRAWYAYGCDAVA